VDFEGHEVETALCHVGDEQALYLVVSSHGQRFKADETFDYDYKLEIVDSHPLCGDGPEDTGSGAEDTGSGPVDPTPGELGGFGEVRAQGCNCTSAAPRTGPGTALLFGILSLVGLRGRRA
jgi:MYXO-CTERM domain-containing protein